jgi:hypothetical protein
MITTNLHKERTQFKFDVSPQRRTCHVTKIKAKLLNYVPSPNKVMPQASKCVLVDKIYIHLKSQY